MTLWTATDNVGGKPKYLTAADKAITYGVDNNELGAASGSIVNIVPDNEGSGYTSVPNVTITGATGANAAATAVVVSGKVVSVNITNVGNGAYTTATATVPVPTPEIFDGATGINATTDIITITGHAFVTDDKVVYLNGGGTTIGGLTNGDNYYAIFVDVNNISLSLTPGGVAIDLSAGVGPAHSISGERATLVGTLNTASGGVAHTGWVKRTVGSGGRAGRVHYETLVAVGITADAADDLVLPDA